MTMCHCDECDEETCDYCGNTWDGPEICKSCLGQMVEALEFAEGAIKDAITLEDGLDASAGEAVLKMIRKLI